MGWKCSSSLPAVDSLVYGFRGMYHLSRRSPKKTGVAASLTTREKDIPAVDYEHHGHDDANASNPFLHLVSSPELTLSICHFVGTASSKDCGCVSQLSNEVVSTIMHHLRKLLPPQICVVGGRADMKVRAAIEAYTPATDSWEIFKPMQSGRNGCGAVVCREQLYTIGGRNAEGKVSSDTQRYDLAKDEWVDLPSLHVGREKFACAQIGGGIYIAGGWGGKSGILDQTEYFDPDSGQWTSLPPLPQARYACGGVAMHGCLYVVGGLGDAEHQALSNVDVYDPWAGKWTSLPPLSKPRFDCAVAAMGGRLIVIGGRDNVREVSDAVECFDPVTGTWETLPSLVAPRFGCNASTVGNKLYVFGGWDTDAVSRIEELDFSNEKLEWNSSLSSMPTARGGCAVTVLSQ